MSGYALIIKTKQVFGPHGIQMHEQAGLVVKHMHMRLLSCVGVDIMRANQKKKVIKSEVLHPQSRNWPVISVRIVCAKALLT